MPGRQWRQGANGVIVGSAIVEIIERHVGDAKGMERELSDYIVRMKAAVGGSGGLPL